MKKNFYTYCTLKYQHSPFLDESLNIGVLIYFHDSQEFSFTYSKNLHRIKSIYSNVPEKTIKEYIRQIERRLSYFKNLKSDIFPLGGATEFSDFVYKNILVYDASCLKFDGFKTQNKFDFSDIFIDQTIVKKLFIDDPKSNVSAPQEPKIIKHLFEELNKSGFQSKANPKRYIRDYQIPTNTGQFNFDFAWKNGVWNLVKPIGFDLKTTEGIIQKARQNLGEFTDLYSEVDKKEYKTNVLVGRPSDKKLFSSYDKALKILDKSPNTEVIEEDDFVKYSHKVIKAVSLEI
jgi:hypothetical protein